MSRIHHRPRGRTNRDVWLLCIASALGSGAYLGMQQLLNPLYMLRLGYGPETVGSIWAAGSLSFCAACLLGGILGTRVGSGRTLAAGVVIFTLGLAMPPLTGSVPRAWQLAWLVAGQITISIGWSMQVVSVIAAMAEVTDVRNRRGAYAIREASASGGMLLGAAIGGLLPAAIASGLGTTTETPEPYALALWVTVLGGALTLVPAVALLRRPSGAAPLHVAAPARESAAGAPAARQRFRLQGALLILVVCGFMTNAAHAACKTFAAVYMDSVFAMPTSLIGAVTSAGMGATTLAALGAGRLARRRSSAQMMVLGAVGIVVALLIMALVPGPLGAALGVIGVYGILGLWRPAYQALQMETARPEERSMVSAASSMGMSLGFGLMGIAGGRIATGPGYPVVFLTGAALAALSAVLAGTLARRSRREAMSPGASPALEEPSA